MSWLDWYNSLAKPNWTPEPATIGLIWHILYPVIVVTFAFIFVQAVRRKVPWLVALPFAINLVANLIFTPIQFGMRNLPLASVDNRDEIGPNLSRMDLSSSMRRGAKPLWSAEGERIRLRPFQLRGLVVDDVKRRLPNYSAHF